MERDEENLVKLKREFEKVRKQYSLPTFEELDNEFDIRKIDFDLFIVKEIRRSIIHKLSGIAELFEPVLNPSENLHSAVESKIFEKTEVDDMYSYYRKVWHYVHKGITASLMSEDEEATYIKEIWKIWPEIKKTALKYSQKLTEGWAREDKEKSSDHYMS